MNEIDDIVGEFLVESHENLDRLDEEVLALERDPTNRDVLGSIFRTIHTVKGTSGFLGFETVGAVAHAAENLLGLLRDGHRDVTDDVTSALLDTGDALRRMLMTIEDTGEEGGTEGLTVLVERLDALQSRPTRRPTSTTNDQQGAAADDEAAEDLLALPWLGQLLVERGAARAEHVAQAARQQELGDGRRLGEILVDRGWADAGAVEEAVLEQQRAAGRVLEASVRVEVGVIDGLARLVEELGSARDRIRELTIGGACSGLAVACAQLDSVTTDLRRGITTLQRQPVSTIWNRLPRIVRDLAVDCGKQVRLEIVGEDVELDRTILEAMRDPLTHLVRNAVDHGIELPQDRLAAGKPEEGRVVLRAAVGGDRVTIEITDDGAGIDAQRLCEKAIDKNIVSRERATVMAERAAFDLVFVPGLTTATTVTSVSGRGVGMDVVRTNVERIGGTVDVSSERGRGSRFRVVIPLEPSHPSTDRTDPGPTS